MGNGQNKTSSKISILSNSGWQRNRRKEEERERKSEAKVHSTNIQLQFEWCAIRRTRNTNGK